MGNEYLKLAEMINSLGGKYDLLDLVDYLADLLFVCGDENKETFRSKCLFSQYD